MKTESKISIFFIIITIDLLFFIAIKQHFPKGYAWVIDSASYYTGVTPEVIETLLVIAGFVTVLICVPIILYLIYNSLKDIAQSI